MEDVNAPATFIAPANENGGLRVSGDIHLGGVWCALKLEGRVCAVPVVVINNVSDFCP